MNLPPVNNHVTVTFSWLCLFDSDKFCSVPVLFQRQTILRIRICLACAQTQTVQISRVCRVCSADSAISFPYHSARKNHKRPTAKFVQAVYFMVSLAKLGNSICVTSQRFLLHFWAAYNRGRHLSQGRLIIEEKPVSNVWPSLIVWPGS